MLIKEYEINEVILITHYKLDVLYQKYFEVYLK